MIIFANMIGMRKFGYLCLVLAVTACGETGNKKLTVKDIEGNTATAENPQGDAKNLKLGTPKFESDTFNFGKVIDGETVTTTYTVKNIGEGPLTINAVQPGCGCTTKEYTKEVIPAGGKGFVKVMFDSKNKGDEIGSQTRKSVKVVFGNSTIEEIDLSFTANVYKSKQEKQ